MEQFYTKVRYYDRGEYIDTASGNKISNRAYPIASQNIIFSGKSILHDNAIIRGDLGGIRIGRWCVVSKSVVLHPPHKRFSKGLAFFPMQIGEYCYLGENSIIQAASIGSYVHIGKNVILGRRCIIKDCCFIDDDSVVAADTVVPSFSRYAGSPAMMVKEAPECMQDLMIDYCKSYYNNFQPKINY